MPYYAVLIVGTSLVFLAGWAAVFRDQQRMRLLVISFWLFALPTLFLVLDNHVWGLLAILPYIIFIAFEEGLKLAGSRFAHSKREAFSLVLLFGIWEVFTSKTVGLMFQDLAFYSFLGMNYGKYSIIALMPILMHSLTAAVYALLKSRLWIISFSLNLIIHFVFNYSRDFYFYEQLGRTQIYFEFVLLDVSVFVVVFISLWTYSRWSSEIPQH